MSAIIAGQHFHNNTFLTQLVQFLMKLVPLTQLAQCYGAEVFKSNLVEVKKMVNLFKH